MIDLLANWFIRQSDDRVRGRIFSLALCYRFDKNLLAKLWGIPSGEVAPALADIASHYSFLLAGGKLHGAFRERLRTFLIAEHSHGEETPRLRHF